MITIRRAEILFYCALFLIAGIALGLTFSAAHKSSSPAPVHADWTVASCSLWANTSHPKLPKYTITTICVTDDGKLSAAFDPSRLHDADVTK